MESLAGVGVNWGGGGYLAPSRFAPVGQIVATGYGGVEIKGRIGSNGG